MVPQHGLGDALVHADSRSQDTGADVRHAQRLEMSLQDSILTERPVQDGEHHRVRGQARTEVAEHHRRVLSCQVVGGGQRLESVHIVENPTGVDPLSVVGQADHFHREPGLHRGGHDPTRRDA